MHRDRAKTRALSEAGIALCEEQNYAYYLYFNRIIHAWAKLETDDSASCVVELKQSTEANRKTGMKLYPPYFLALTAEGLAKTDELDEALIVVEEARPGSSW